MNDQETRELCKAVYDKLEWVDTTWFDDTGKLQFAYSLEYVLDRIPTKTKLEINKRGQTIYKLKNFKLYKDGQNNWTIGYSGMYESAATPLQAALRLVLALADAGVLS